MKGMCHDSIMMQMIWQVCTWHVSLEGVSKSKVFKSWRQAGKTFLELSEVLDSLLFRGVLDFRPTVSAGRFSRLRPCPWTTACCGRATVRGAWWEDEEEVPGRLVGSAKGSDLVDEEERLAVQK